MVKFVVKTPSVSSEDKKHLHLPVKISAKDRARKYPEGTFHVDDDLLFCSSCSVVIDHLRKSVVGKHLEAVVHKQNVEKRCLRTEIQLLIHLCVYFPFTSQDLIKIRQQFILFRFIIVSLCSLLSVGQHKSDFPPLKLSNITLN